MNAALSRGKPRNGTPEGMTEKDFQRRVKELMQLLGYRIYHHRPAQVGKRFVTALEGVGGFPDLIGLRPPRLVVAELKVNYNRPTEEQQEWIRQLNAIPGVEAYVWWPKDWDEIVDVLRRREVMNT